MAHCTHKMRAGGHPPHSRRPQAVRGAPCPRFCSVGVPLLADLDVEVGGLEEFVRVEVAGAIATIRLDRPKMNALNRQVQDEIAAAAAQVSADASVRAVILYGGERVFAAGADIKEMADLGYPE